MLWEAPTETESDLRVNYLIGIHNDILYAGSANEIIAYDLNGDGRMLWNAAWSVRDSLKGEIITGQCCLTTDALYVPLRNSILKLDLNDGHQLGQVGVRLVDNLPVGSLYSDGKRLWAQCANRLIALGPVPKEASEKPK